MTRFRFLFIYFVLICFLDFYHNVDCNADQVIDSEAIVEDDRRIQKKLERNILSVLKKQSTHIMEWSERHALEKLKKWRASNHRKPRDVTTSTGSSSTSTTSTTSTTTTTASSSWSGCWYCGTNDRY